MTYEEAMQKLTAGIAPIKVTHKPGTFNIPDPHYLIWHSQHLLAPDEFPNNLLKYPAKKTKKSGKRK